MDKHHANFRFHEELHDFLPASHRKRTLDYAFNGLMRKNKNAVGPVAHKVLAALKKERTRKVIDFESLRLGAERTAELERDIISNDAAKRTRKRR